MNHNSTAITAIAHLRALPLLLAFLALGLLAGCGKSTSPEVAAIPAKAVGSCALNLSPDADDEAAIEAVLKAEGESVVSQDIDTLMRLWATDGQVSDAKYTPDDDADNQNWGGKDAIRHRYVRTVFPGAPASVRPSDLEITIDSDQATVTATTHIGEEVSPAGDRWQLVRVDSCWLIQSLTYNLEPGP